MSYELSREKSPNFRINVQKSASKITEKLEKIITLTLNDNKLYNKSVKRVRHLEKGIH